MLFLVRILLPLDAPVFSVRDGMLVLILLNDKTLEMPVQCHMNPAQAVAPHFCNLNFGTLFPSVST